MSDKNTDVQEATEIISHLRAERDTALADAARMKEALEYAADKFAYVENVIHTHGQYANSLSMRAESKNCRDAIKP